MTQVEREGAEKKLNLDAQELYAEYNRAFIPMFPWVFVRVLSKEQTTQAGLILPDIDQNKTIHEGIVLSTWKPFRRFRNIRGIGEVSQEYVPPVKQGDHVVFPHWAGLPIAGFTTEQYRVIRSEDWSESTNGGMFAIVDYEDKEQRSIEKLKKVMHTSIFGTSRGDMEKEVDLAEVAKAIQHQFLLVDRDKESVTLSGR